MNKHRLYRLTEKDEKEIVDMLRKEVHQLVIMRKFKTCNANLRRLMRENNIPTKKERKAIRVKQVVDLAEKGKDLDRICDVTGYTMKSVRRILRSHKTKDGVKCKCLFCSLVYYMKPSELGYEFTGRGVLYRLCQKDDCYGRQAAAEIYI